MKSERLRTVNGWGAPKSGNSTEIWTFYLEGGISQFLPVPGAFDDMRFQSLQDVRFSEPDMRLNLYGLDSVKQSVFAYQLTDLRWSHRAPAAKSEIALAEGVRINGPASSYPNSLLELAVNESERSYLESINNNLLAGREVVDAKLYSQLATDYLRARFRYSLKPNHGKGEDDPIMRWLANADRGHCELFAGAFILMAREAGYPARMAVGFSGGAWNSVEEYFLVRNKDAHAWVEILDRSTNEWLRVDPTPGAGASDPEVAVRGGVDFVVGWTAWLDSLRIQWYRRIVNFDQDDQIELAMTIGEVVKEYAKQIKERAQFWMAELKIWLAAPFSKDRILQAGCFVVAGLLVYAVWWSRYGWLSFWHRWRKRPEALAPVRRQAGKYLARLKRKLSATTRDEHSEQANEVRNLLEAIRFGPQIEIGAAKETFSKARRVMRML